MSACPQLYVVVLTLNFKQLGEVAVCYVETDTIIFENELIKTVLSYGGVPTKTLINVMRYSKYSLSIALHLLESHYSVSIRDAL